MTYGHMDIRTHRPSGRYIQKLKKNNDQGSVVRLSNHFIGYDFWYNSCLQWDNSRTVVHGSKANNRVVVKHVYIIKPLRIYSWQGNKYMLYAI